MDVTDNNGMSLADIITDEIHRALAEISEDNRCETRFVTQHGVQIECRSMQELR